MSLTPLKQSFYNYLTVLEMSKGEGGITSKNVAEKLNITSGYAGKILRNLRTWGYIEFCGYRGNSQRQFDVYTAVEEACS